MMTKEEFYLSRNTVSSDQQSIALYKTYVKSLEAQLKSKDEEIKELGEIVQQYLIPSKNYNAIIRYKDEEIVKLKLELFRSSPKITNKKARSIVAMLFWRARKDKRLADEENKFFTYDIALHSFIIFRQAHKMLKDNL